MCRSTGMLVVHPDCMGQASFSPEVRRLFIVSHVEMCCCEQWFITAFITVYNTPGYF